MAVASRCFEGLRPISSYAALEVAELHERRGEVVQRAQQLEGVGWSDFNALLEILDAAEVATQRSRDAARVEACGLQFLELQSSSARASASSARRMA